MSHPLRQKQFVSTVDALGLYHHTAGTRLRKRTSDRESSDKESVKKETKKKNAKLGSEPNVWSRNARGKKKASDRSVGRPKRDGVTQSSGKQDVSKKREIENKQGLYRSEKTVSVSGRLTERGKPVKNGPGDVKRKIVREPLTVSVSEPLTERSKPAKNGHGDVKRRKIVREPLTVSVSERLTERGKPVKTGHGDVKRRKTVREPLTVTDYAETVMNAPYANTLNSSVLLERTRPIFLALRVILPLFTKTKAISIGATASFILLSGRII